MVFGFFAAAFAAYSLTAMRSWSVTGVPSTRGVAFMVGLWGVARLAVAGVFGQNPLITVPLGSGFLVVLSMFLGQTAIRSCSGKGGFQASIALILAGLQIATLNGVAVLTASVFVPAALLSVIGGRMIEAFTWNRAHKTARHVRKFRWARVLGIVSAWAIVAAALSRILGLANSSQLHAAPVLLWAVADVTRLALWQSGEVWRDGLLTMLHMSFAWLPIGLVLLAAAGIYPTLISEGEALHALTVGAISGSVYAVAARAVAVRSDRLVPGGVDLLGFWLLWLAAVVRVFGTEEPAVGICLAAVLWGTAWALFLVRHSSALLHPPPRPVFSGRGSEQSGFSI